MAGKTFSEIIQLVTFQLGNEFYGVDIMLVNSIVRSEGIRHIPNAPSYVEGIYNLRGEIIPVINLHNRFNIPDAVVLDEEMVMGMMIIEIGGKKLGLLIDNVSRVLPVESDKIQPPPQTISGIGREFIRGVYRKEDTYIVILDVNRIFDPQELQHLKRLGG